ncbi:MAG: hypothetical protein CBC55_04655 [Gammaproteobacteria bacterium TMED95]|nr:MAG: hypothetical protein CBC55_04655 [Gammaproteobacteria bacterium TMED95]|tara:strand:+ start:1091 stop:2917 length:1827 start_codon:yes stop_codon:yes gene_type:complete
MNDLRKKEHDAARAVSMALNKEAISKIDKTVSAVASTLDAKVIKAMSVAGIIGGAGAFAMPSAQELLSASPQLILASTFVSLGVLAATNFGEFFNSPSREKVYLPGKEHSLQRYFKSFEKAEQIRKAYSSSKNGNALYDKGYKLADSMALKFFMLRKTTNPGFARLFMKSYPTSADTREGETARLKAMDRKSDTYRFYRLTNPNALEQRIDRMLSRQANLQNVVPSDFDYYLVQLLASAGNDSAISRVIQESPLAQWLQPLFDNNKQVLDALQADVVGNKKKMIQFVRDMHFALGDLSSLVLGKDLSNYAQIKEYEKLTLTSLGDAVKTVQTSILHQSLCEDIGEFLTDVYDRSQAVPIEQFSALVTRLLMATEGQRFSAKSDGNPSPSIEDAKLGDLAHIAGVLGHLLEDMCLHGKNELTLADIRHIPQLDRYFSKMVQNAAASPDREERVANIAQALHQQSFGKPMVGFSEKDLHSQWFENLFKDIHEKAMMGIRKLESPALQAKYLDELLEEYPARLSDLQQHRVQVSKMSKVLAAPIVSVKDLASSAYDVVTRKHVNSISPAEINSSHDLGVAVGKLEESLSGPPPSPANNASTPQVVVQNTRP